MELWADVLMKLLALLLLSVPTVPDADRLRLITAQRNILSLQLQETALAQQRQQAVRQYEKLKADIEKRVGCRLDDDAQCKPEPPATQ